MRNSCIYCSRNFTGYGLLGTLGRCMEFRSCPFFNALWNSSIQGRWYAIIALSNNQWKIWVKRWNFSRSSRSNQRDSEYFSFLKINNLANFRSLLDCNCKRWNFGYFHWDWKRENLMRIHISRYKSFEQKLIRSTFWAWRTNARSWMLYRAWTWFKHNIHS